MPGLRGALSIRVNDGQSDRIVTRYCRGLKFTKVAPGGHQSLSFRMVLPRNTFTDLGPADRCYVYDARTARTVIEGYLENPTPVDGPDGQEYAVSAVGGMALLNDETRGLIYIDQRVDSWKQVQYGAAAAAASASSYQDATVAANRGMRVKFTPGGTVVSTGQVAAIDYRETERAGMLIAAVRVVTQSGKNDTGYRTDLYDFTAATTVADPTGIQTGTFDQSFWVGTNIATTGAVLLQLRRSGGAVNIADDTTWTNFLAMSVLGRRYDRYGNLLGTSVAHGGNALGVLASQVAEDLLGRLLTFCDPATAQIDTTSWVIDQMAYPDGVKAAGVLSDLTDFEPNYLHEILETLDNGKHRFNYRAWPTTPRYEVSIRDGWQQKGSDVDLCNRILVSYTDPAGNVVPVPVTAASLGLTVEALGSRVKDADPITLSEGFGSAANATRIGGQILTDKINPPKAGTVLVRRPILDLLTGSRVMPWEIEPGCLCRIRETGDDLRITQVDYDDDSCSMLLTLGAPVLTTAQRLANLVRSA